jgi:hypothetical protein
VHKQGISARRRSTLLQGLNNAVYALLRLAEGEENQKNSYSFFDSVCNFQYKLFLD